MNEIRINRDYYLNRLINLQQTPMIKIVSGVRRCGKSYLLFKLFREHLIRSGVPSSRIISMQLDNFKDQKYRNPRTCYDYVASKIKNRSSTYYLLIDEVQLMDQFESALNGFLYFNNLSVYVTGSNSRFLVSDVATEFRGRGFEIRVRPLSFAEFYNAKTELNPELSYKEAWSEYCLYGGMPGLFQHPETQDKIRYLQSLVAETYLKDLIERNKIRQSSEFSALLDFVASNIGALTSIRKLTNAFKSETGITLSGPTLSQYLRYFTEAFLVSKVSRYDIKGKHYLDGPCKYYLVDPGLRNARLNFRQHEVNHIMENIVYNELAGRGYSIDVGCVNVRDKISDGEFRRKQLEVDFVVNFGSDRVYVQVAQTVQDSAKFEQETSSLLNVNDHFRKVLIAERGILFPRDAHGIILLKLKDFLLNPGIVEEAI